MEDYIVRKKEVCKIFGLSASAIERKIRDGFLPRPILIGKSRVGWWHSEIIEMINFGMAHPDEEIREKSAAILARRGRGGRRRVLMLQADGAIIPAVIE